MNNKLKKLKQAVDAAAKALWDWEIDTDDSTVIEMYESMLSECYGDTVEVCGMEMDSVRVLKEMDPTAYRCGLNDYADGLDKEDFPEYVKLVEAHEEAVTAYDQAVEGEDQ